MRPCVVREDIARAKAKSLLKDFNITRPPVWPEFIAADLDIQIHYHEVADVDFSFSVKTKGKYIICVQITGNKGRDRWSIAHELGHIILGHYELYAVDTVTQDRLTNHERYILDREADIFTEELLMPAEWLINKTEPLPVLQRNFLVSKEALNIRMNTLSKSCRLLQARA
jgi:Zn-dependent peptidase ImmA (M78 family)